MCILEQYNNTPLVTGKTTAYNPSSDSPFLYKNGSSSKWRGFTTLQYMQLEKTVFQVNETLSLIEVVWICNEQRVSYLLHVLTLQVILYLSMDSQSTTNLRKQRYLLNIIIHCMVCNIEQYKNVKRSLGIGGRIVQHANIQYYVYS